MKPMIAGMLVWLGVLTASAQAQVIYKCMAGKEITYQQTPCEVAAPAKGVSSDTALVGQWSFDHDATVAWMKRHAPMTKDQQAALDGLAGHMTYTFTKERASLVVTDNDMTVNGRVQHQKGVQRAVPYAVLSVSPQLVAVSAQNPDTLSVYKTEFHFEGHDRMWISMANQKLSGVDDANARIYYVRTH